PGRTARSRCGRRAPRPRGPPRPTRRRRPRPVRGGGRGAGPAWRRDTPSRGSPRWRRRPAPSAGRWWRRPCGWPRRGRGGRASEDLLDPAEEAAGRAELLGEDTDAGAVAQHVVVVQHVDDVEARLHLADARQGEALGQAEVDLLVRWVRRVVG